MSKDWKLGCTHDYCPDEYCMDRAHLVANADPESRPLVWLGLTVGQASVLEYILQAEINAFDGPSTTAVHIILDELREIL